MCWTRFSESGTAEDWSPILHALSVADIPQFTLICICTTSGFLMCPNAQHQSYSSIILFWKDIFHGVSGLIKNCRMKSQSIGTMLIRSSSSTIPLLSWLLPWLYCLQIIDFGREMQRMSCQFKTILSNKIEVASFLNPTDKKLHKIPHKLLTSLFLFTFLKTMICSGSWSKLDYCRRPISKLAITFKEVEFE